MAIGVIATITVRQGRNAEFEQAFLALAEQVRAHEPDNIFYILHRSRIERSEPDRIPEPFRIREPGQRFLDLEARRFRCVVHSGFYLASYGQSVSVA